MVGCGVEGSGIGPPVTGGVPATERGETIDGVGSFSAATGTGGDCSFGTESGARCGDTDRGGTAGLEPGAAEVGGVPRGERGGGFEIAAGAAAEVFAEPLDGVAGEAGRERGDRGGAFAAAEVVEEVGEGAVLGGGGCMDARGSDGIDLLASAAEVELGVGDEGGVGTALWGETGRDFATAGGTVLAAEALAVLADELAVVVEEGGGVRLGGTGIPR